MEDKKLASDEHHQIQMQFDALFSNQTSLLNNVASLFKNVQGLSSDVSNSWADLPLPVYAYVFHILLFSKSLLTLIKPKISSTFHACIFRAFSAAFFYLRFGKKSTFVRERRA